MKLNDYPTYFYSKTETDRFLGLINADFLSFQPTTLEEDIHLDQYVIPALFYYAPEIFKILLNLVEEGKHFSEWEQWPYIKHTLRLTFPEMLFNLDRIHGQKIKLNTLGEMAINKRSVKLEKK